MTNDIDAYNAGSITIIHLSSVETAGRQWETCCSSGCLWIRGSINTLEVCLRFSTNTVALTMVFKLYGIYRSPWVRLVAAVLKEKQIPFELIPVDLANGEQKTPDYLEKHPFGQVPYIVCDAFDFFFASGVAIYSH